MGVSTIFGYVLINKPELKVKEFDLYKSYYCGLCESLKKRYGLAGRMTVNYDMVFLDMTLADMYDVRECGLCKHCIVHPFEKHSMTTSEVSEYCSDMNVLLAYYKCLDDWNDEHKLKSKFRTVMLKGKAKKAIAAYPEKAKLIAEKLEILSEYEKADNLPLDKVAHVFGEILGTVFIYRDDVFREDLYKLGFYLGKFIYLLDAYEDVEKDIATGDYNPFKSMWTELGDSPDGRMEFDRQVYDLLLLMIGEATDAFERLPLLENVSVLRNILYSGVWARYGKSRAEILGLEKEEYNGSI